MARSAATDVCGVDSLMLSMDSAELTVEFLQLALME